MKKGYNEKIETVSKMLAEMILAGLDEEGFKEKALMLDKQAQEMLREIGLLVMKRVFGELSRVVTVEAKRAGLEIERNNSITFNVIFGPIEVKSPYLSGKSGTARPVKERLGITAGGRSIAVERAMVDFGAEESFGQATKRFAEHYGWDIGRTTVLRVTEGIAKEAEQYVEERLASSEPDYYISLAERPGEEQLLIELDGSDIRTAVMVEQEGNQTTPVRGLKRRNRQVEWHEVRLGLVGRIGSVDRTYIARMGQYPEVCSRLFRAAVIEGLSARTEVVAVGDGGIGLMEELKAQFPNSQFILDKSHLKSHLYGTAEAAGYSGKGREDWVIKKIDLLSSGQVDQVLEELTIENHYTPCDSMTNLTGYINRFKDAVAYDLFVSQGFPIGSGEVESAHRYIPQKRLKIPGASWKPSNINPMLALRIIRANNWWDDFWSKHTNQICNKLSRAA